MRCPSITFTVLLAALTLAGCGAQPGQTMMTYNRGKDSPPTNTADTTGVYSVYPNNSGNAIYTVNLRQGDEYGFRRNEQGNVVAVVKGKDIPLNATLATAYYWKVKPAK